MDNPQNPPENQTLPNPPPIVSNENIYPAPPLKSSKTKIYLVISMAAMLLIFVSAVIYILMVKNQRKITSKSTAVTEKEMPDSDLAQYKDMYENIQFLDGTSACAMGLDYQYSFTENYPPLIKRKVENGKEILTPPTDMPTDDELKKMQKIDSQLALNIIDGRKIRYSDNIVPKANIYYYQIEKSNVLETNQIIYQHNFCNSSFPQGSIGAAVRLVWEFVFKPTKTKLGGITYENPEYDIKWHVYVDAITGEVVYVEQKKATETSD